MPTIETPSNSSVQTLRKREYRIREEENKELIVSSYGSFVGLTKQKVTVRVDGEVAYQHPVASLEHITIAGKGITLSSNLIEHCLLNKIPIDFFGYGGRHCGSILSNSIIEGASWNQQAMMAQEERNSLAKLILSAKMKNQINLVRYFHKYHKHKNVMLPEPFEELISFFEAGKEYIESVDITDDIFLTKLVSYEAQCAVRYWHYLSCLLSDDNVSFNHREQKGAVDLVNCMLNYGYAILYSRVWHALLKARLSPYESVFHVRQAGKPTFVYDIVEIFRSPVVDRVVITMIQKGHSLSVEDGLLDEQTRGRLASAIIERLNKYERYRGERMTTDDIIKRQAKEIAYHIEGIKEFRPYISKW